MLKEVNANKIFKVDNENVMIKFQIKSSV